MKKIFQRRVLLAVALSIVVTAFQTLTPILFAQNGVSGDISGIVITDPTVAVIPGAKVTIVSVDTGARQTVVTNSSGTYRPSSLKPGNYKLTFTLARFEAVSFTATASAGAISEADAKLPIVSSSTVEEVTQAALFSTPRAPKFQPKYGSNYKARYTFQNKKSAIHIRLTRKIMRVRIL